MMKTFPSDWMPRQRSKWTGSRRQRHLDGFRPGHTRHGLGPAGRGLVVAAMAWSIAWKGASLWRASRDDSKPWFLALLLSNTLGILDAIYLYAVSGTRRGEKTHEESILTVTGEPEQLGHPQET